MILFDGKGDILSWSLDLHGLDFQLIIGGMLSFSCLWVIPSGGSRGVLKWLLVEVWFITVDNLTYASLTILEFLRSLHAAFRICTEFHWVLRTRGRFSTYHTLWSLSSCSHWIWYAPYRLFAARWSHRGLHETRSTRLTHSRSRAIKNELLT